MLTTQEDAVSLSLPRLVGKWRPRWQAWVAALLRWVAVWALACAVTVGLVIVTLHPPAAHVAELLRYLLVGGAASVLLAGAALWITDVGRIGGVAVKFAVPTLLTALIISFNVLLVAHGMFLSQADGLLVLDMLVFSVIIALTLAAAIARPVALAIRRVEAGARRMASGEYSVRLPENEPHGAVELERLAGWFNQMAASVEEAFKRREQAEHERREVVAALSHDLRTPLASIRAMIEAITDGVVTDHATIARYQQSIRGEVRHLSALMDDLFDLSRLEANASSSICRQHEPVALDDLISDTLEATRGQADRLGIALRGRIEGELPLIDADASHIHRVLTNLTQNALRHTPRGGVILMQTQRDERSAQHERVLVRVVDSGEGIAERDLPHVFEPMYRGEASRPRDAWTRCEQATGGISSATGAGLGLTIARRLVEAYGGQMWAESPLAPETAALLAVETPMVESPQALGVNVGDTQHQAAPSATRIAATARPGTCVSFTLPVKAPAARQRSH
jgi:signal transduction histidine kinase